MPLSLSDLPGQVVKDPRIKIISIDPPRIQPGQKTTVTVQITNPNDFDVNCSCDYQVYANLWEYSFGPLTEKHLCSETLKAGETVTKQFQPPAVTNGPNYVRVLCELSAKLNGVTWYTPPTLSPPGAFVVGKGEPSPMLISHLKFLPSSKCDYACLMADVGYTLINTSAESEIEIDTVEGEIAPHLVFQPETFTISSNTTVEPLSQLTASRTVQFHTFAPFTYGAFLNGTYYGKRIHLPPGFVIPIPSMYPPKGHNWNVNWYVVTNGENATVNFSIGNTGNLPITNSTLHVVLKRWNYGTNYIVVPVYSTTKPLGGIQPGKSVSVQVNLPASKYLLSNQKKTTFFAEVGVELKFADGLYLRVPIGAKKFVIEKQSSGGGGSGSNNSSGNTQPSPSPAPVVAEQDTVKVLAGTTIAGIILYELMRGGGKT